MEKKVRIGIIGCGGIAGSKHMPSLKKLPNVEMVAFCDIILERAENAKAKFAAHGYELPRLVFWNVASRSLQQPVTMNEEGVMLVSGFTPRLFSMVASDAASPYALMLEILESPRYEKIVA